MRKIVIGGAIAAAGVAYAVGVRAGFDAAVHDYLENGAQMIERAAAKRDKFDTSQAPTGLEARPASEDNEADDDDPLRNVY